MVKAIAGIILIVACPCLIKAQSVSDFRVLDNFRKWSIVMGPVVYNRASTNPQYGEYAIENLPIYGFTAGIEYDFFPSKKWSFVTGVHIALEPVYRLNINIMQEDLFSHFDEDFELRDKMYSMFSINAPLLLHRNIQIGNKTFISLFTGLKVKYFPNGSASMMVSLNNDELSEIRDVFSLKLESPQNSIQGSFVVGAGFSRVLEKVVLKAGLIYIANFQNAMTGEYQFTNLMTSSDSGGYSELSGNYLGLFISMRITKNQKEK